MRQIEHYSGRRLRLAVWALLSGSILYLFGRWCLTSTDIPPPPLALPLPERLLGGLGFMLWNPFSLIPLTLALTASRFLVARLNWPSAAAVTIVCLTAVLGGAVWVPNPIVLWPFSVLGEHTLPELIGELFTFHIVPAPRGSYSSTAGLQSLCRWQLLECGARFCILLIGWTGGLVAIWRIDRRMSTTQAPDPRTGSEERPGFQIGPP